MPIAGVTCTERANTYAGFGRLAQRLDKKEYNACETLAGPGPVDRPRLRTCNPFYPLRHRNQVPQIAVLVSKRSRVYVLLVHIKLSVCLNANTGGYLRAALQTAQRPLRQGPIYCKTWRGHVASLRPIPPILSTVPRIKPELGADFADLPARELV